MPNLPVSGTQLYDVAIYNAQVPPEGPKAAGLTVPFATATTWQLNLTLTQAGHFLTQVSSIYFDNSANGSEVLVTSSVINQTIRFPPNSCGYLPILAPKNCTLTFYSEGGVNIPVILLNVPVPAVVYTSPGGGNQMVAAPASTTTPLGASGGAIGDYLDHVQIIPLTTSPGAVQIQDGTSSPVTIFAGGASSVTSLVPFTVPLGITSKSGGWSIICSANVQALAFGEFT